MEKTDITKSDLYVNKILKVIKSGNSNHHRILQNNGRHSDAFVYIIAGSCTYRFDGKREFTANPGDVLYLAHSAVYTMFIHTEDYQFIFCDFEFRDDSEKECDVYTPRNVSDAENLFYKLLNSYTNRSDASFTECMTLLYEIYGTLRAAKERPYIGLSAKNKISEAKRYIDESFRDTELKIADLAKRADMSDVYFRKLFRAQYGLSPVQYVNSVRLKNAKDLLKYPFLTLEECALQSGFSSLQYFCRVFKSATNTTPSKYRRSI